MRCTLFEAAGNFNSKIPLHEMAVRSIGLPGKNSQQYFQMIRTRVQIQSEFEYSSSDDRYLSQTSTNFDAYVVHGDDLIRIKTLIRRIRSIYTSKAIVFYSSPISSADRVEILNAGADCVVEFYETGDELSSLLRLLKRRMQWTREDENLKNDNNYNSLVWSVKEITNLRLQERDVLDVLADNVGEIVDINTLLHAIRRPFSSKSVKHVSIIASRIRKSLPAGYSLVNVRHAGYKLVCDESAAQRVVATP